MIAELHKHEEVQRQRAAQATLYERMAVMVEENEAIMRKLHRTIHD